MEYRLIVDIATVPESKRRAMCRRIKRRIERHYPFHKRTGNLSASSYVDLYSDLNLMVVGARAEYTSYLVLGTSRITGHNYIKAAVLANVDERHILRETEVPNRPM